MKTSEKTDKLFPALFKAKQEFTTVSKSADNPFFKSKYASLNEHLEVVDPVLYKNGLMLIQPPLSEATNVVETVIVHAESGQWISGSMALVLAKNSMQDAGSAVTYARRYVLGSLLALRAEDDDGETAVGRGKSSGPSAAPKAVAEAAVAAAVAEREAKKSTFRKPSTPTPAPATGGDGWDN
jgi:hypothetical protein